MYRVLIADDEEPILQGLQVIVPWRQLGFEICGTATDGELALELIAQKKPDLVLMDIRMPGVDGMEAIETARRQGYQGYFIILSGASDFGYAQRAMRSRTSFYLTKPIDEDELADAVRSIAKELDKEGSARRELTKHARSSLLFRLLNGVYDPQRGPAFRLLAVGRRLSGAGLRTVHPFCGKHQRLSCGSADRKWHRCG